jgi:hypothetical protein
MLEARELTVGMFATNVTVLVRNTQGMTDGEAARTPGDGGSNILWNLGHILQHRDQALGLLGAETILRPEHAKRFATGSLPSRVPNPFTLEQLLNRLETSQARLEGAFRDASLETLAATGPNGTVLQRLHGLAWHETYHVGQTGSLRRGAGLKGAIG